MGNTSLLCLLLALGLFSSVSCRSARRSDLHSRLRRALATSRLPACLDKPECATQPDEICTADPDLAVALCPAKCGSCVCEDNAATEGSCPQLVPDICEGELAVSLCAKTCGLCAQSSPVCFDHVIGLSCAELPDPCNDPLGMIACPKFCGMCQAETTTIATTTTSTTTTTTTTPTTTTSTTRQTTTTQKPTAPTTTQKTTVSTAIDPCLLDPCLNNGVCNTDTSTALGYTCMCPNGFGGWICQNKPPPTSPAPATTKATNTNPTDKPVTVPTTGSCSKLTNKNNVSCVPAEVVFMVEYARSDKYYDGIDHEIDFVKELVDAWELSKRGIRVGVVVYHDTVSEAIHISDFKDDVKGLNDKLNSLKRDLKPSGDADLGRALDFVRRTSFVDARPGVEKIVIPIVHNMNSRTKNKIVPAAKSLKDDCVIIIGLSISSRTIDWDIMGELVTQPYSLYYTGFTGYDKLEDTGRYINWINAPCNSQNSRNTDVTSDDDPDDDDHDNDDGNRGNHNGNHHHHGNRA